MRDQAAACAERVCRPSLTAATTARAGRSGTSRTTITDPPLSAVTHLGRCLLLP
ncbi:hypothetical protein [Actinacidiphila acididurans]|uniref:Uncharacterized protein n=1 Tax=Actinacidiphila acididurans TaxID=2784346 RepID=A0ABS2TWQ3_9ACTN|nr:hypothetical protein [Actinacidiphila acididurans]MBM9506393.1 hypothetical protein [Actinacidiphila acididurans]